MFLYLGMAVFQAPTKYNKIFIENYKLIDSYLLSPYLFLEDNLEFVQENITQINKGLGLLMMVMALSNIFGIPEA